MSEKCFEILLNLSVLRESFILTFFTYLTSVIIGENVKNLTDKAFGAHGQQSFKHSSPLDHSTLYFELNRMRSFGGGRGQEERAVAARVVCVRMCVCVGLGGGEHLGKTVSCIGPIGSPDCQVQCSV